MLMNTAMEAGSVRFRYFMVRRLPGQKPLEQWRGWAIVPSLKTFATGAD
jgi:hypothetical protein